MTPRYVMHKMYIGLKETCSKTQENVINRKFNAFDIKYGINFTRETESF